MGQPNDRGNCAGAEAAEVLGVCRSKVIGAGAALALGQPARSEQVTRVIEV